MVASSIYILDKRGKPLIFRNYRNDLKQQIPINQFIRLLSEQPNDEQSVVEAEPVIFHQSSGIWFIYVKCNGLFFVACTVCNSNIFVIFEFLNRFIRVLGDYFGAIHEESIRDNFVLIYELLDEMLDYGYPQITEFKVLMEYITQEGHRFTEQEAAESFGEKTSALASNTLSSIVNWRPYGLKYKKNEVYVDVIESLNMQLNANGTVVHSEIAGVVRMKCLLSGMPEVKIGLNERLLSLNEVSGELDQTNDLKFHTCVRLAKFENERIITFVPPDGEFDLLTYRIKPTIDAVKPIVRVQCNAECLSSTRLKYTVTASVNLMRRKGGTSACNLEIFIPVPPDADTPKFQCSIGRLKYLPEIDRFSWKIKHCPSSSMEYTCTALFGLPTIRSEEGDKLPPLTVNFEIPYFTVSGAQVKYLKVTEKSGYQTTPWVRYVTKNGDYQIRIPEMRKPIQSST